MNGLRLQFLPAGVSEEHFLERLTEGMSDHLVAQMQIPQAWQSEEAGGSGKGPGCSGVVAPAKGGKGGKGEGGKGEGRVKLERVKVERVKMERVKEERVMDMLLKKKDQGKVLVVEKENMHMMGVLVNSNSSSSKC